MKKVLLALFVVAVLLVITGYVYRQPVIVYLSGQLQAKLSRPGRISGQNITKLNVPFHRQQHALSCEVASLKMALNAMGADIPESELIANLNFDPTPKYNGLWGNPYKGFVGDIDGVMLKTGYGVYWEPIAKLGLRYRRTQAMQNASLTDLIDHLEHGRPVVVWGYFGQGDKTSWVTQDGLAINAIQGEHARVLIGFTGPASNPETLILLDPIYGELSWRVNDFLNNWGLLEYGAVAVYPYPRWVKVAGDPTVWEINANGTARHGIASWENFVAQEGLPEGIVEVQAQWLNGLQTE